MRTLQSLAAFALVTTLPWNGSPHRAPVARRAVPAAAETPPIRLTADLLQRMTTFMVQMQKDPARLRTLAADSANYAHVPRRMGPFRHAPQFPPELPGAGTVDALLDLGAIAAKDPTVAAAFTRAHLAPTQYLRFVTALQAAEATDAMEIYVLEEQHIPVAAADSAVTVIWQNVAFLRTHRAALDALELPLPSPEPAEFQDIEHFLDTALHPVRIRYMKNPGYPGNGDPEPWPTGFLDSTDAPDGGRRAMGQPWRVLFIGNSFTYYNTMPRLFSKLAAQGLHRRVVVGLVSIPGASPLDLWATTDLRQVLAAFPWDAVVAQLKGAGPLVTRQTFPYYAQLFTQASAAHHTRTVLWSQWLVPRDIVEWRTQVDSILATAATATGATFAPVGKAWAAVRQQDTATWRALFGPEGDHPSQLGSYLVALVLYRTLTGQSPVGLPSTLDSLSLGPLRTTNSLSVPIRTAELLQGAAAAAHP